MAGIASLWVRVPTAVQILSVPMAIDYATGLLKASIEKRLCSTEGINGLRRKTLTMLLVMAAGYLVRVVHLPVEFAAGIAVAFCLNEVISIIENCADAGVPIPPALLEVLLRAKKMTGRGKSAQVREDWRVKPMRRKVECERVFRSGTAPQR